MLIHRFMSSTFQMVENGQRSGLVLQHIVTAYNDVRSQTTHETKTSNDDQWFTFSTADGKNGRLKWS